MLYPNKRIDEEFVEMEFADCAAEACEIAIAAAQKMRDDYEAALTAKDVEIDRLTTAGLNCAYGEVILESVAADQDKEIDRLQRNIERLKSIVGERAAEIGGLRDKVLRLELGIAEMEAEIDAALDDDDDWQCEKCKKFVSYAEGTDNEQPNWCDDCWAAEYAPEILVLTITPEEAARRDEHQRKVVEKITSRPG